MTNQTTSNPVNTMLEACNLCTSQASNTLSSVCLGATATAVGALANSSLLYVMPLACSTNLLTSYLNAGNMLQEGVRNWANMCGNLGGSKGMGGLKTSTASDMCGSSSPLPTYNPNLDYNTGKQAGGKAR